MGKLSHLDALEAEAIYIIREVAAECEKPVMLYSIGKDSSVMMHLALKAFYPEKPPFPFLRLLFFPFQHHHPDNQQYRKDDAG